MSEREILRHAALAIVFHKIADGLEKYDGHDREEYLEDMRDSMGEDFRRIEETFMDELSTQFDEMIDKLDGAQTEI